MFSRTQQQLVKLWYQNGHLRVQKQNWRVTPSKPILNYIHSHHGYINYGIIGLINVGLPSHFSQGATSGYYYWTSPCKDAELESNSVETHSRLHSQSPWVHKLWYYWFN